LDGFTVQPGRKKKALGPLKAAGLAKRLKLDTSAETKLAPSYAVGQRVPSDNRYLTDEDEETEWQDGDKLPKGAHKSPRIPRKEKATAKSAAAEASQPKKKGNKKKNRANKKAAGSKVQHLERAY
jgi:hypothetical protein